MMVHEHYMDFSYAPILHRRDVPAEIDSMPAFNDIEVTETTVSYTRLLPDAQLVDWEADATGLDRDVTYKRRESGTFVSPRCTVSTGSSRPRMASGTPPPEPTASRPRRKRRHTCSYKRHATTDSTTMR